MKKILLLATFIALLTACDKGKSQTHYSYSSDDGEFPKRELKIKNAANDIEIEMKGAATFNKELTTITSIKQGGYIKYRNADTTLNAKQESNLVIAIECKGKTISNTSYTGKEIIAEAAREVKKLQDKKN